MRIYKLIFTICLIVGVLAFTAPAIAQPSSKKGKQEEEEKKILWESHSTIAETFKTKFPTNFKYNIFPFHYDENKVAYSAEIFASLSLDEKINDKYSFIRSTHTIGEEMSAGRAKKTIERYFRKYIAMSKSLNGNIITQEDLNHKGFLGKTLYVNYQERGKSSKYANKSAFRVNVYATNYAIIEQVLFGPAIDMFTYRYDDFFDSIQLFDGLPTTDSPLGTGWVTHTSPNKTFTIKTPPIHRDYTPELPTSRNAKTREQMQYKIHDPVVGKNLYYKLNSYKLSRRPSDNDVKSILMKNHLSKFVSNIDSMELTIKKTERDDETIYDTSVVVSPSKRLPYITKLSYSIIVKDDFMLIKEFMLGNHHYTSGIERTFFDLTEFHPERYEYTQPPKEKASDAKEPPPQKADSANGGKKIKKSDTENKTKQ